MILRCLTLRDFRRFASYETDFASGLNVIVGDNETGKSTLREAITAALFYDPKTSSKAILGLKCWGAAEQFAVELEFEVEGEVYRLTKDFQKKSARLENLTTGALVTDGRAIDRQVGVVLGLASKSLFDSTVRVSQREITNLQNAGAISDGLQRVMTGGEDEAHASKVVEDLGKALSALRTASNRNPGPLFVLPGEIQKREGALGAKRETLKKAAGDWNDLMERETDLGKIESDLKAKQAILEACAKRLRLAGEREEAVDKEQKLADRLNAIRDLSQEITAEQTRLSEYEPVLRLSEAQVGELAALKQQAAHEVSTPSHAPGPAAAGPRLPVLALGAILALTGVVCGLNQPLLFALLVLGAAVLAWEVARSRSGGSQTARAAAELYARQQREEAERAASDLQEALAGVGCQSLEALLDRRRHGLGLRDILSGKRGRLEGLLAGDTEESIEQQRKSASGKARQLADALDEPSLALAKLEQGEFLRLSDEVERLQAQQPKLAQKVGELKLAVQVNQIGAADVHSLEEELAELQRRLTAVQERQKVLALARDVMEEARQATMLTAGDVLEKEMGGLVGEITRGRYAEVKVEPGTLAIQLRSPESPEAVRVGLDGDLSTGTVEQVYLAARLTLAKLLSGGKRPPLLLDDPFVTFDGERTAAVLALLKRLSAENQVLLFTCHADYRSAADHVILLPPVPAATLATTALGATSAIASEAG